MALKAAGIKPGDAVLSNCFTLAPVPGAIAHAQARPVLVDVADDYTFDLDDLDRKAAASGAKTLLLSHMRGHIYDMDRLTEICLRHGVQVIEDCAHTMGALWRGKATGIWGRAGCFSLQSYKHANSGEGGLGRLAPDALQAFLSRCAHRGVHIKWFGAAVPVGFASVWQHWRFFGEPQSLPNAEMGRQCGMGRLASWPKRPGKRYSGRCCLS